MALSESLEHADLDRTETSTAREDEGGDHAQSLVMGRMGRW
jgi:hypothetical protein